jgi:hypothetical protein
VPGRGCPGARWGHPTRPHPGPYSPAENVTEYEKTRKAQSSERISVEHGIAEDVHVRIQAELFCDAFGADGGLIVHSAGPWRTPPQHPPGAGRDQGELHRVLLLLARHKRPASWLSRGRAADLDLGPVDSQPDPVLIRVREHVRQRAQP